MTNEEGQGCVAQCDFDLSDCKECNLIINFAVKVHLAKHFAAG